MYKILVVLLSFVLLLSVIPINLVNSDNFDFIPYVKNQDHYFKKDTPIICLYESDPIINGLFDTQKTTTDSINEWIVLLKYVSGSIDKWNVDYYFVEGKYELMEVDGGCDVNIKFELYPYDKNELVGGTTHRMFKHDKYTSLVFIYTHRIDIDDNSFKITPRTQDIISEVLKHEMGHVFGLGHLNDINKNYDYNLGLKSIMYYQTSNNKDLTMDDVLSVIMRYGTDGWDGFTNTKLDRYIFK